MGGVCKDMYSHVEWRSCFVIENIEKWIFTILVYLFSFLRENQCLSICITMEVCSQIYFAGILCIMLYWIYILSISLPSLSLFFLSPLQSVAMQWLSCELSVKKLHLLGLGPHLSRIQNKVRHPLNVKKNDCLTIRNMNVTGYWRWWKRALVRVQRATWTRSERTTSHVFSSSTRWRAESTLETSYKV